MVLIALLSIIISSAFSFYPAAMFQEDSEVTLQVTQVDTSNFPQVKVYISAVDSAGDPLTINPGNLVLRENGQAVKIDLVEGAGDSGPLTTLLVMDISGSMNTGGKLSMARKVAGEYISQMRSNDMAGIIAFNNKVQQVQPVTIERDSLLAAIDGLRAGDDTAMYDALVKATEILNPLSGRKAIIVLTDGLDNRSTSSPSDVLNSIGESGLSISTIGLGNPGQSTGNLTALDEKTLSALAVNAGGSYGLATDQTSLQRIYEKYGRVLQSEYVISYSTASTLRDGINRSLSVSLEEGGIASWSNAVDTKFNPGGLVPEVSSPNSWGMFGGLLACLVALLFLPVIIRAIRNKAPVKEKAVDIATPKVSRVKLK